MENFNSIYTMTPEELSIKLRMDYLKRKLDYDRDVVELELKRKQFLEDNPNHPYKNSMYLNVIAPPQEFIIKIIR